MNRTGWTCAVLVAASMLGLGGCGGGGSDGFGDDGGSGGGGGGGGGSTTTELRAGQLAETGAFTLGTLAVTSTALAAGGQTGLRVDIVEASGARTTQPVTVTLTSDCVASGLSTITPATVDTTSGRADATYVAQGCAGTDTIRAVVTSTADPTINSAVASVTVAAAALGGLDFVSATPTTIGMSGSPIPKQSTVVFRVTNASAGVVPNQRVRFALSTTQGGITLSPTEAISDAQGLVQTVVAAGSAHTAVRVVASADASGGGVITTTSDLLTISTGLPDQDSFSLGVEKLSVDGNCDGEPDKITIRAADRYNNPVPNGTAITFTTEGGKIAGQCFTGDPLADSTTEAGVCTVLLTVQNPRPADGRATVLATAVGEESFFDDNGNGYYDSGDPGDPGEPVGDDLGEAYLDANENGVRDAGEMPVDYNANGQFDASGDGAFTGYVCDSPGLNCRSGLLNVRRDAVVVFSSRVAKAPADDELAVIPADASSVWTPGVRMLQFMAKKALASVAVVVRDSAGNPLPTGTTYELSTSVGTVLAPSIVGPYNTNNRSAAANTQVFTLQAPAGTDPDSGLVSLIVHLPASACSAGADVALPLFTVRYL